MNRHMPHRPTKALARTALINAYRGQYPLLSSNVALIGGNSTKPGSGYYALIKAALSLRDVARVITRQLKLFCRNNPSQA